MEYSSQAYMLFWNGISHWHYWKRSKWMVAPTPRTFLPFLFSCASSRFKSPLSEVLHRGIP